MTTAIITYCPILSESGTLGGNDAKPISSASVRIFFYLTSRTSIQNVTQLSIDPVFRKFIRILLMILI